MSPRRLPPAVPDRLPAGHGAAPYSAGLTMVVLIVIHLAVATVLLLVTGRSAIPSVFRRAAVAGGEGVSRTLAAPSALLAGSLHGPKNGDCT